ncbi:hypothetical protein EON65_47255 [archaeon]|nr:MAG: hypothetical protein EON65_47255 [archaeon]
MVKTGTSMKEEKLSFFLKHISKAVKVAKTFLVLKCTKKIKQLREEGKSDENEAMKLAAQLHHSAKSINQAELAKAIVYIKYPYMLRDQDGAVRMDDVNVQHVMASKQFQHAMSEIEDKWQEHEIKEIEYRERLGKGKKHREGRNREKSDKPLLAAKLVGQKRGKERIPLGKAMFVDTLDSESAVVIGQAGNEGDEEVNEVKRLKSLRNQRNRIVNRLKRDNQTSGADDMNIYLPVHLRNLPEPTLRKTKGNKSNASSTANSSDGHSYTRAGQNEGSGRVEEVSGKYHTKDSGKQRKEREQSWSDKPRHTESENVPSHDRQDRKRKDFNQDFASQANKRSRPNQPHITANNTFHPVVDIGLAAAGRHWQEAGIHPSWAAKQLKQQQAISIPPVGVTVSKKIVFDD